ncbi:MAG: hypothetical protein KZQ90_13280 [Candidatus Thiodiazotropha sp. (ex Codakia rugifera)]|nr:hypothetical protein [Candidatus Thiodiazotropha sp. (ex Codakia rugifera)]
MLNKNEKPNLSTSELLNPQIHLTGRHSSISNQSVKGSIRELERMATRLREKGDNSGADCVDLEIMVLLEKKICKKIVNRSRREQKRLQMGLA